MIFIFLFCFFDSFLFFFAVVVFEVFYGTILVLVICFLPFCLLFALLFCSFSF